MIFQPCQPYRQWQLVLMDCLPDSGSVLIGGNEFLHAEVRIRIIIELALFKEVYLSSKHLHQGICVDDKEAKQLPAKSAQMNDTYIPGQKLTKKVIESIYDQEVHSICEIHPFISIWQIFAF